MLEWIGDPCIDKIGIPCSSESSIDIVFLVAGESRNAAIICFAYESSITLRDSSGVNDETGLPIFWCL